MTAQQFPFVLDLECKLVINRTSEEFVTSDNPVVLYNQLLSFKKVGSNTGFACKGLEIFFPISPDKYLVFFDPKVYRVGSRNVSVVNMSQISDVYELNTLQVCSAAENVYFCDSAMDITALHRKAAPYRRSRKANVNVFPGYETEEYKRELLTTHCEDIRTNLKISCIRPTKSAKNWRKSFRKRKRQSAVVVRNEELCEKDAQFRGLVETGEYHPWEFLLYLKERFGGN